MNDTITITDRAEEEAAALMALAIADGWAGPFPALRGRIGDVPSATDWLCDHDHQIAAWNAVHSILSRYVAGGISIADARVALDRVLS